MTETAATMSVKDAAARIGITYWQAYYAIEAGHLKTVQDGGPIIRLGERRILVHRERLETWLEGGAR